MLVVYNKVNILRLKDFDRGPNRPHGLMPGANDVDEKAFAEARKKYPIVEAYIADGTIEIPETAAGQPIEASELGKLKERDAIKLVRETADELLLLSWHESESAQKRKNVVKEIEKQMAALAAAGEPAKKKDGATDELGGAGA